MKGTCQRDIDSIFNRRHHTKMFPKWPHKKFNSFPKCLCARLRFHWPFQPDSALEQTVILGESCCIAKCSSPSLWIWEACVTKAIQCSSAISWFIIGGLTFRGVYSIRSGRAKSHYTLCFYISFQVSFGQTRERQHLTAEALSFL